MFGFIRKQKLQIELFSIMLIFSFVLLGWLNGISINASETEITSTAKFTDTKTLSIYDRCPGKYCVYSLDGPHDMDAICLQQHYNGCECSRAECIHFYTWEGEPFVGQATSSDICGPLEIKTGHDCNDLGETGCRRVRRTWTRCNVCYKQDLNGSNDYVTEWLVCRNNTGKGCYIQNNSNGVAACIYCGRPASSTYGGKCNASYIQNKSVSWNTKIDYVSLQEKNIKDTVSESNDVFIVSNGSKATVSVNSLGAWKNGSIVGYQVIENGVEKPLVGSKDIKSRNGYSAATWSGNINSIVTLQFHIYTSTGDYYLPKVELISKYYNIKYILSGGRGGKYFPAKGGWSVPTKISNPINDGFSFVGWDIDGCDEFEHYWDDELASESSEHTTDSFIPYTRIGKATSFLNLRSDIGSTVTMTAKWIDDNAPIFSDEPNNPDTGRGIVYVKEDGTKYTPDTWTEQGVKTTASAYDMATGVYGFKWVIKAENTLNNQDKTIVRDYPEIGLKNKFLQESKVFVSTGEYSGTVYAKDNADTVLDNVLNHEKNESSIDFGRVRVDKTNPEGEVTYFINNKWTKFGNTWTNKPVTVKITAKDVHSGLPIKAFSWDDKKTWISADTGSSIGKNDTDSDIGAYTTKEFKKNVSGTVYVKDAVGNISAFTYKVSGIDVKPPTVYPNNRPKPDDVPGEPLPWTDYENPEKYDYPEETDYTYNKIGVLTYDWVNHDINLKFNAKDEEDDEEGYAVSGIKEMRIYEADKEFNKNSLVSKSKISSVSYLCQKQGISYYVIEAEDKATNITTVNITVKIDKTAPIIPLDEENAMQFEIEDIDLDRYGVDEVEDKIKDSTLMKRSFLFNASDYNNPAYGSTEDDTDSSGISEFTLKLINSIDDSDFKEYELGYLAESALNTKEFSSSSVIKALLSASFVNEINTFTEFPNAPTLKYEITIKDRAGNETVYNNKPGNEIKNFSIKAVIYYAGITDEDINGSAGIDLNVLQNDANGKTINIPYFKAGEFGYVEAWTIGYVPEIQFDFGEIGSESVKEISENKMSSKYNLGITSDVAYMRKISVDNAEEIQTGFPKVNGVPYASHFGVNEKKSIDVKNQQAFMDMFKEKGTSIRLPIYYTLEPDGTKKADGRDNYKWELHYADIKALKGNGRFVDDSNTPYVIWDTRLIEVHHRVTHES